jgi:hypothetical protein
MGKSTYTDTTSWKTLDLLHYPTACPLKLFYTFQCGQNDKEHNDPAAIPPAQHFWSNAALRTENNEV